RIVDGNTSPRVRPLELRDLGHRCAACALGIAEEDPDEAVAHFERVRLDAALGHSVAEELVLDVDQAAPAVVAPSVVRAAQPPAFHLAERELQLPMRTSILERVELPRSVTIDRD